MKSALTPRELAEQFIEKALASVIRGAARDHLKEALLALQAASSRGPALTDAEFRKLKPGQTLRDRSCPGLSLKNGPRTGTIWVYRYKMAGSHTPQETKLGNYPDFALSDSCSMGRRP